MVDFDIFDIFDEYIRKLRKILIRMNIYNIAVGTSVSPNSSKTGFFKAEGLNAFFGP